jgi:hypothetical protein
MHGTAAQPNPMSMPQTEELRQSKPLVIETGNMDITTPAGFRGQTHRIPLRNTARFTVVSRDRIRIHIQLEHKWPDHADAKSWDGHAIINGSKIEPYSISGTKPKHVSLRWDYDAREAYRDVHGDVTGINHSAPRTPQPFGSTVLFRGEGTFNFYKRDIIHRDIRKLSFVLERGSVRYVFTWRFTQL